MRVLYLVFCLSAVFFSTPSSAVDIDGFDAYYEAATLGASLGVSDVAITRQSSCAIQLKNFVFGEVQNGNFIPQLTISFKSGNDVSSKVTVVFDDVIKSISAGKTATLKLSNKFLATGVILSRVTSVLVELRLIQVNDSYRDFAEVLQPILNSVQVAQPAFGILESFIAKVKTGPDTPLLFSGEFLVASNRPEYNEMSKTFSDAFLKNNQEYLMTTNLVTPVADDSISGKLTALVNAGAKAVVGKSIVDPASANVKGYATLIFTKDKISLLPVDLENALQNVQKELSRVGFSREDFNVAVNRAENTNAYLDQNNLVDRRSSNTVTEFLALARVYADYRSNKPIADWGAQFSDWLFGFKIRSATLAAQAVGVKNLYPSAANGKANIAPLYLPYFLAEDLLASFQSWQLLMHRALMKNNTLFASVQASA